MTTSREPTARLCAWGPTVIAVAAFVLYALRDAGAGAAAAPPLWRVLADVASLVPVGDLGFRLQLLSATAGALAALWSARLVLEIAVEPDAAAAWGAITAGALTAVAAALLDAATSIGPAAVAVAALAGTARLLVRVAAGAAAPAGLGLVIALGLGVAAGPGFAGIVPVGAALLIVRLYRGARFPLAAPVLAAVVVGGLQIVMLIRGAAPTPPRAAAAPLSWLLSLGGDSLGPFGAIAAAAGLIALWRRRRTLWIAAALTAVGSFAIARALAAPDAARAAPAIWAAAVCAGFGVAALVRLTGRFALAAGAGAAALTIAPAAVLALF